MIRKVYFERVSFRKFDLKFPKVEMIAMRKLKTNLVYICTVSYLSMKTKISENFRYVTVQLMLGLLIIIFFAQRKATKVI